MVKADISEVVAGLHDFEQTQLPFAIARTLTALAKDSQAAVQENVKRSFTLRNTWTEKGIRIVPAKKTGGAADGQITATVYTDTANRVTGAPDYLGRQETGGEKVPFGGHQYIAVPTKYLRQMCPGPIPAELRPRNLLGATGGRYTTFNRKTGGIVLKNQVRVRGFEFFLQKIKDGHMAILGRYMTDRDAYPFYLLITEAHVRKSGLLMEETVRRVVDENFQQRWQAAWRDIRLRGIKI